MKILISKIKELFDFYDKSSYASVNEEDEVLNDTVDEEMPIKDIFIYKCENLFSHFQNVKFGIEIEFQSKNIDIDGEDILKEFVSNGIDISKKVIVGREGERHYQNWQLMKETSCNWEIISPVLQNILEDWKTFEQVCNVLQNSQFGFYVDENCAIHIHINRESILLCGQHYVNLMNTYRYLEPLIYGVSAGEDKEVSLTRVKKYAATLAYADKELWCKGDSQKNIDRLITCGEIGWIDNYYWTRLVGINFMTRNTGYKTVEFRTFNGTFNPALIQFYLEFILNIIYSCTIKEDSELPIIQFWEKNGEEFKYNKEYIDECIRIMHPNEYLKKCILGILWNIHYNIPHDLFKALIGKYSEEERKNFIL